ncbi:hypothetical protein F2P81_014644 [Scophthalmus maximus]|uniref:Uncharacterized protein n=1 Tax=Scophthalmus maximus TaxID=52904 RepID=A0A6A4SMN2_SCOMX|nr:hypothetical protein F2P81_014644 [Scophthalmus maximus]
MRRDDVQARSEAMVPWPGIFRSRSMACCLRARPPLRSSGQLPDSQLLQAVSGSLSKGWTQDLAKNLSASS